MKPDSPIRRKGDGLHRVSSVDLAFRIKRAREMDVSVLSSEQVRERVRIIMGGYATQLLPFQLNGMFRARCNVDEAEFTNVSQLWYPPQNLVQRRGRFNERQQSVFYASNNAQGAIYEVHAPIGGTVTVLCCNTRGTFAEIRCAHIGLARSLSPAVAHASPGSPLKNGRLQAFLKREGLSSKWAQVDDFLADMATARWSADEEEDRYKTTNAIAQVLMIAPHVDGLNYPSVATNLRSVNLCLRPEVADKLFAPVEAWTLRTEEKVEHLPGVDHRGPFFRTTFLRRTERIDADGTLHWIDIDDDYPVEHLLKVPRGSEPPWRGGQS